MEVAAVPAEPVVAALEGISAEPAEQGGLSDPGVETAEEEAPVWHAAIAADSQAPAFQEPSTCSPVDREPEADTAGLNPAAKAFGTPWSAAVAPAFQPAESLSAPSTGLAVPLSPLVGAESAPPVSGVEGAALPESPADAGLSFEGDIRL